MMKKLIINNMSFKFNGQKNYFFHNAHIIFESGNTYFIQGKNGVGKSTFFSILQGTIPRNATLTGAVIFDNKEFIIRNNCFDQKLSCQVKTVVQDVNSMIVNAMTVEENLQLAHLPRYPRLIPLARTVTMPALLRQGFGGQAIMHGFNIDQLMKVQQLSGGQKQILAIMMALQKPTHILLLDEPTAALDEKNTHMVIQFLNTLAQEMDLIIIIITHDKELTQTYAHNRNITIKKDADETRTITFGS
jgi:ABC-type lipoprotein export system ATPase subunit